MQTSTAAMRTSCARSPSSATSPTWPQARCSCRSAAHACCAPRRSTRTYPAMDDGQRQGLGHRGVLDAPGLVAERIEREADRARPSGRTQEIQRLIGRSLRAVCDMVVLGERQVIVDCDVLQADGGTRTASICGGYLALHDALSRLVQAGMIKQHPITERCAAISVGIVDGDAGARPRLRRGLDGRGRHERGDDGVRPLRRGAGHGRGHAVHPRASSTSCSSSGREGHPEIVALQDELLSDAARTAVRVVLASANPDKAEEIADDPRPAGHRAAAPARRRRPTSRRRPTRSRATLVSRRSRSSSRRACPRSPTTPGSRSTCSAARPGVHTARYAGDDATYADNVAQLLEALKRHPSRTADRAVPHGRAGRAGPTGERWSPKGSCDGQIALGRSATAGSATTRCSSPTRATAARSRRCRPERSTSCHTVGERFGRSPRSSADLPAP